MKKKNNVVPLSLSKMAASITSSYGDEGAIIITRNKEGNVRIGVHNLTPSDLQEMLCVAIYQNVAKNLE